MAAMVRGERQLSILAILARSLALSSIPADLAAMVAMEKQAAKAGLAVVVGLELDQVEA